ncbi:17102_t:CDS:1 [Entrophospora sp. SA101]|nr:17102_t:CDS:1 [Entrophospora sp. SA101]
MVNCKFIKSDQPDENGFYFYLLHKGHHEHQKPIQNKPFNNEIDMFKKSASAAPDTLPQKLHVGQSLEKNNPFSLVRNISDAFSNTDQIAYYLCKVIEEENLITKTAHRYGDNFVLGILQFQLDHPNFIRRADFANKGIIILQSDWMEQQTFSSSNFSGIVTDSTFQTHSCYPGIINS